MSRNRYARTTPTGIHALQSNTLMKNPLNHLIPGALLLLIARLGIATNAEHLLPLLLVLGLFTRSAD